MAHMQFDVEAQHMDMYVGHRIRLIHEVWFMNDEGDALPSSSETSGLVHAVEFRMNPVVPERRIVRVVVGAGTGQQVLYFAHDQALAVDLEW